MPDDDLEAQLAAMANDPEIQRENRAILEEFAETEMDGLEDESMRTNLRNLKLYFLGNVLLRAVARD